MNNSSIAENISDKIRLIMKLRREGVTDTRVLSAIESVPRELFIPESLRDQAYEDTALPIAAGQTISQPTVVAWMSMALEVGERMKVLEIGTGSGYQTAILSLMCRRVYSMERHKELHDIAMQRFGQMKLRNITAIVGDGYKGWEKAAPFERIIVTAAAPEVPQPLLEQLDTGGIMVIPVGDARSGQTLLRLNKTAKGIETKRLMQVRFVPLVEGC